MISGLPQLLHRRERLQFIDKQFLSAELRNEFIPGSIRESFTAARPLLILRNMGKLLQMDSSLQAQGAAKSTTVLKSLAFILAGLILFAIFNLRWPGGEGEAQQKTITAFQWQQVEPGYSIGRYELGHGNKVLKPEVFILRFDPQFFSFNIVSPADSTSKLSDLRTLTNRIDGVCGINANFFDERANPLGLLIKSGEVLNHMHRGGKVLTGIFYMFKGSPFIVNRDDFKEEKADIALQAGPRLIVNGRGLKIKQREGATRRSGIAVTRSGNVILYATFLRFPGATLEQIQEMLLDPRLEVTSALNLDGGGSSQLFVRKNPLLVDDAFISGGDNVPVGLVVKRR